MKVVGVLIAALIVGWIGLTIWAEQQHAKFTECIWERPADEWDSCIAARPRLGVRVREINDAIFR